MKPTQTSPIRLDLAPVKDTRGVWRVHASLRHDMEQGGRIDAQGRAVPRAIANRFLCFFNDTVLLDVSLQPGMAADPSFEFDFSPETDGVVEARWIEDDGTEHVLRRTISLGGQIG